VDRENRIILEYRAKNRFQIEVLGLQGNAFVFRIRNGFGDYVAGQIVRVSAGGGVMLAEASSLQPGQPRSFFAQALDTLDSLISVAKAHAATSSGTYSSDGGGYVRVPLTPNIPPGSTLTIQVGESVITVPVMGGGAPSRLSFAQPLYTVGSSSGNTPVQVNLTDATGGEQINWSVTSPGSTNGATLSGTTSTISGTSSSITVTGANWIREVTITATLDSDSSQTASTTVRFGASLPGGFLALYDGTPNTAIWGNASNQAGGLCSSQGGKLPRINSLGSWDGVGGGSVDGFGTIGSLGPSGLPSDFYWTGTAHAYFVGNSWIVEAVGTSGLVNVIYVSQVGNNRVVCVP
jgi:hypothetical protein